LNHAGSAWLRDAEEPKNFGTLRVCVSPSSAYAAGSDVFLLLFGNAQAATRENYLKKQKKERTSFCEQKEAKKL
jgi:hypothetical protein